MSYQGPPGYGNGYPPAYGQHGGYDGRQPQVAYHHPEQQTPPSPGAYTQGRISMQQLQAMQAQNEAAFYQQNQYGQVPYAQAQPAYYQNPPTRIQHPQSYSQYIDPRAAQYSPAQSYPPQYDGSYDGVGFVAPLPHLQAPQQQPQQSPQQKPQQHPQQHSQQLPQQHTQRLPQQHPQQLPQQHTQQLPQQRPQQHPHQQPRQQPRQQPQPQHVPQIAQVSVPKRAPPVLPPVDTYALLPALAEEYFTSAHGLGFGTAQRMDKDAVQKYQKLIATGLGCLEAALAGGRLEPRLEAKIRLRYAGVLLEDTENVMEAETALSKGITICEQNRYFDLKYNMQVLLAKLMFTKRPKAALKALDGYISDVEAYQHHSWIYVFRFLKATLALQSGRTSDANSALQTLRGIASLASDRGDHAVVTISSLMDVLACLHLPSPPSAESIDRALATVNMYQLDPQCSIPPLQALGHILDTTAGLFYSSPDQIGHKLKAMQDMINTAFTETEAWNKFDDEMKLPLNRRQGDANISSQDTSGILKLSPDGKDLLLITLLNKSDVFILCHLLTGVVRLHVSAIDGSSLKYLRQGLQRSLDMKTIKYSGSLSGALSKIRWRGTITCYFYIYMVFCSVSATDWVTAKANLDAFEVAIGDLGDSAEPLIEQMYIYLSAMYFQGTGDHRRATELYTSEKLKLFEPGSPVHSPAEQARRDLAVLAAMNNLWILQCGPHRDLERNTAEIERLGPLCLGNSSKEIQAVFNILRASVETTPATLQTQSKAYIRAAMEVARSMKNTHLVCVVLNMMCERYFSGIVGDQAEKSAIAASTQAKKSGNLLWMSFAQGSLARSLETQGKASEAEKSLVEAVRLASAAVRAPP